MKHTDRKSLLLLLLKPLVLECSTSEAAGLKSRNVGSEEVSKRHSGVLSIVVLGSASVYSVFVSIALPVGRDEGEEVQRLCAGHPEGVAETHRCPQVREDEGGR